MNKKLSRYDSSNLQAWNAADEYIIGEFNPEELKINSKVLIINDHFGALTINYALFKPFIVTDSANSKHSIQKNAFENNVEIENKQFLSFLDDWPQVDLVFIQVPKSLDLLEWILYKLQMSKDSKIILSVMIKHMHNTFYKTLDKYFLEIISSKIVKKARLVEISKPKAQSSFSVSKLFVYNGLRFNNYKSTFSPNKADLGSIFLLDNIESITKNSSILDIGSGNGLLSIILAKKYPDSTYIGFDDSYLAVESSIQNATFNKIGNCHFHYDFIDDFLEDKKFDVIICNPPFHIGHTITESVAELMIDIASTRLMCSGEFFLVCNRHLKYKTKLKSKFTNVEIVSENNKFKVFKSYLTD